MWWIALLGCSPELEDGEVLLTTRDGVDLVADYYGADGGAPGVVLLHMTPPANDRTNWPADFIRGLSDDGYAVMVPDRRGAGDSKGKAEDAHLGESGRYDVEAAVEYLVDDGHGTFAILGASNGTTSMIDYTIWAPGEGLPEPVSVGFLSGGSYTENQHDMSELPSLPAVFAYPPSEKDWPESQTDHDVDGQWSLFEYETGSHGTGMFDTSPEVADDLRDFLSENL